MRVSTLVRDQLGLDYMDEDLRILDRVSGKEIALNVFYDDAKWIRSGQTATYFLTRYFFPVANLAERTVGLHLLPAHVKQGRFVIAQLDPESQQLIEYAHSMPAYLHRVLLEFEAEDEDIDEALKTVRVLLGEDFYREGYAPLFPDDVERTMIHNYGGAAVDYRDLALFAKLRKSVSEQVDWLKRGAATVPDCLYFHWELARFCSQQAENILAAQHFARSLSCHHHTGCGLSSEVYYALGDELLRKVPAAFSAAARLDLTLIDVEERMRWVVSLFQKGEIETSLKLLNDFRYDSGTDLHPIMFEFLRLHYERLGWQWALAWCDLCGVDAQYKSECYRYRGQPLSGNWDQPVRSLLGTP